MPMQKHNRTPAHYIPAPDYVHADWTHGTLARVQIRNRPQRRVSWWIVPGLVGGAALWLVAAFAIAWIAG